MFIPGEEPYEYQYQGHINNKSGTGDELNLSRQGNQ
ncbi:hypothetical protein Y788_11385 [Pantoea dispersa 625]|nr:hypothetical protein Y788_11385 [Pantoea dispersa 625]